MLVMHCNEDLTEQQWQLLDQQQNDDESNINEDDEMEVIDGVIEEDSNEMNTSCLENVMVVSENGFGKRTPLSEYRITKRGGKGIKTLNVTEKTGKLIAIKAVTDDDDLMIINKSGVAIRLALSTIREQGRNTQGVSLINIKKRNDVISSVCKVEHFEPQQDENDELEEQSNDSEQQNEM